MISDKCFLKMVKETIIIANVQDAQPLIINGLMHQGIDHPINYICGKQGGIEINKL